MAKFVLSNPNERQVPLNNVVTLPPQITKPSRLLYLRIINYGLWLAGISLLLMALVMSAPVSRTHVLRFVGHLLVTNQRSLAPVDIVVVAIDADGAGTLEAADLVHQGVSTRVAVFSDPPSPIDREFLRRGLPYEDRAAISTLQLQMLGVHNIEQIRRSTSGSEQEGEILPAWCDKEGYHSVVLITSADHSRRLSRIFRRSLRNHQLMVSIESSPYSQFNPDTWWKSRAGVRNGIIEFEKLLLDIIRHPFS